MGLIADSLRKGGMNGPITGLDLSPKMVELAQQRGNYSTAFVHDLEVPVPCPDRSVSALYKYTYSVLTPATVRSHHVHGCARIGAESDNISARDSASVARRQVRGVADLPVPLRGRLQSVRSSERARLFAARSRGDVARGRSRGSVRGGDRRLLSHALAAHDGRTLARAVHCSARQTASINTCPVLSCSNSVPESR